MCFCYCCCCVFFLCIIYNNEDNISGCTFISVAKKNTESKNEKSELTFRRLKHSLAIKLYCLQPNHINKMVEICILLLKWTVPDDLKPLLQHTFLVSML